MTKIITCSELRHYTLDELEALFRTLQIEFGGWRHPASCAVMPPGITLPSGCDPVSAVGTSDAFSERVLKAQP